MAYGIRHEDEEPEEIEVGVIFDNSEDSGVYNFVQKINESDPLKDYDPDDLIGLGRNMKRKLQKRHVGANGARSHKYEEESTYAYSFLGIVEPPYNLDNLGKLYEVNSANAAAIDAKVANIVGLGFHWEESDRTAEKLSNLQDQPERLEAARRKIARARQQMNEWLDTLNQEDNFSEVLHKVWTDLEATGNGYLEIGRTKGGQIGYIGHIHSPTMRVRASRDGFIQIVGNKVTFFRNFGDTEATNPVTNDRNPNEVIHFKKYSPGNSFYGTPDVLSALDAVAGNKFSSQYNLDFFENKAVPRYVLIVKGATLSSEAQRLLKQYMASLKGKHHGTLYIPVPGDRQGQNKVEVEFKPIENGVQEAGFVTYYNKNRDEILMAHRTPLTKVGLSGNINLAVARDADKMFKEQVCRPAQRNIEQKLNRLFKEVTDMFVFKLNELTLTDEDTQSKIWERLLRMQVVVPNEVRQEMGWKGRPGGDEVLNTFPDKNATQRDQTVRGTGARRRDQERTSGPDKDGEARQPKGEASE